MAEEGEVRRIRSNAGMQGRGKRDIPEKTHRAVDQQHEPAGNRNCFASPRRKPGFTCTPITPNRRSGKLQQPIRSRPRFPCESRRKVELTPVFSARGKAEFADISHKELSGLAYCQLNPQNTRGSSDKACLRVRRCLWRGSRAGGVSAQVSRRARLAGRVVGGRLRVCMGTSCCRLLAVDVSWSSVRHRRRWRITRLVVFGHVWLRRRVSVVVATPGTSVDLCFTAFGVGPLVFVRGSMNTEAYCNILDNEMLPTLWRFYGMDPCYFQEVNARYHVSRATMQWYAENNVRRLDWPAQSSDINPIEHLWDELDRRVRARQARPKSIAHFMEWLQEDWRRIPVDVLQTLVESMPDRVAAVIAARGGVPYPALVRAYAGSPVVFPLLHAFNAGWAGERNIFRALFSARNLSVLVTCGKAFIGCSRKIKLDPGSELGLFDLGSGKMLRQRGISEVQNALGESIAAAGRGGFLQFSSDSGREGNGGGKREIPEKTPLTCGIVRYDSHLRKSEGDPAGDCTLMGGEESNRSVTAAPQG
ncbi:hypothetical protein PR048_033547 [Dryococelus australis]|uniref:Transposase n=1 Tax=Dryococelus australis TaxID=614101 RepID=A0ABQ9G3V5_9NEOP|nr:hypothetical protein PR048_033547 [Dryococelus australis]